MSIEWLVGIPFVALAVALIVGPAVVAAARRRRPVVELAPEAILDVFFDPAVSRAEAVARTAAHDEARVRWTGETSRVFEGEQSVVWLSFWPARRDGAAPRHVVAAEFPLSQRARLLALPPRARVTVEGSLRFSRDGDGVELVAAVLTAAEPPR